MIRQATRADINDMVELLHQLFAIEADFDFSAERQQRGLEMLLTAPEAKVMVAEEFGKVVGMVTAQLVISTAEGGLSQFIEDLVILPALQNQGLGTALLTALAEWGAALGANRMQLLADRSNTSALQFYHHRGWRQTQLFCLRKYISKEIFT
ncbi:MAG: GNAT family N-acetyltransferase [Proteobacteria bacterium]|nr:GNAT family N-acetyltransferase [Pseudomonadota bacterium]